MAKVGDVIDFRPEGVPEHTIGFQAAAWAEKYLVQPDGPEAGKPWRFTNDQLRMLSWFYAVNNEGRFVYRDVTVRQSKGSGKSILAAILAAIELCGPCRWIGWDETDEPVADFNPSSWVVIAATSSSQTRNTMLALRHVFSPAAMEEFGLAIGQTVIHSARGGRAETVTSSPLAMEGARATFTVVEESANWLRSNGGWAMFEVISRNAGKSRDGAARVLQVTNAHESDRDSVAERTWNAYSSVLEGRSRSSGQLYWAVEAPANVDMSDRKQLVAALETVYDGAPWISLDRIVEEIWDPRTSQDISTRYYLNKPSSPQDGLIASKDWDGLRNPDLVLNPGDVITLGFDGSLREDSTALVAQRISDRAFFLLAISEKPEGPNADDWEVNPQEFSDLIANTFEKYEVVGMAADVHPFETYIEQWENDYSDRLKVKITPKTWLAYDMRSNQQRTTKANEGFIEAVLQKVVQHDGNLTLRRHVLNTRRRPNRVGISFGKESKGSSRKIDAYAALLLSEIARAEYVANGERPRKSKMIMYR